MMVMMMVLIIIKIKIKCMMMMVMMMMMMTMTMMMMTSYHFCTARVPQAAANAGQSPRETTRTKDHQHATVRRQRPAVGYYGLKLRAPPVFGTTGAI